MPKYQITVSESYRTVYVIEADDEDAAREVVDDNPISTVKAMADRWDHEHANWEVTDVCEVEC